MAKVLSFSDLQLISGLSHLNEFDMLLIENDDLMAFYLDKAGMDVEYAVQYIPSQHRNLQNKVVVGFQAVGDLQHQRAFLNSVYCLPIERIAAYGEQDRSLTVELASLSGTQLNHSAFHEDMIDDSVNDSFYEGLIEPSYRAVESSIKALEDIRDSIRGSMYDESGNPKTRQQYKEWLAQQREGA